MFNIKKGKEEDIIEEEKKVAEKLKELAAAAETEVVVETDYEQMSPVERLSTDKLKHIYEIPIDQIDPFPDHPFKV